MRMIRRESLLVLAIVILAYGTPVFSQIKENPKIPNFRLSLSASLTAWKPGKAVPVKLAIENLDGSSNFIVLPTGLVFHLEGFILQKTFVTRNDPVFWSPVSLTKAYEVSTNVCQDDLTKERVLREPGGSVSIVPAPKGLVLMKGEKKEFDFDLSKTCWNHQISSVYPNERLFELAKFGKYKLFCKMEFTSGGGIDDGIKVPVTQFIKSNEIEIVVE